MNGYCDDGGPGAEYTVCPYGTDCTDCGPRVPAPSPPPQRPNHCPYGQLQCWDFCLAPLPMHSPQCPPNPNLPRCHEVAHPSTTTFCEGDGECGTNQFLNNCNPGDWDIYQVFVMQAPPAIPSPPSPPPSPPQPPDPPTPWPPPSPMPMPPTHCTFGQLQCYQNCLTPLAMGDPRCPVQPNLPRCHEVEADPNVDTFCEGDGECGTDQVLNNCNVRAACTQSIRPRICLAPCLQLTPCLQLDSRPVPSLVGGTSTR